MPGVRGEGTLNSVPASPATCLTAEYIIHFAGAVGIKPLLTFNSVSLFYNIL